MEIWTAECGVPSSHAITRSFSHTLYVFKARNSRPVNVRVNDPASSLKASNALVPRTYNRPQFESAWGRSGGLAYVIHPATKALPARPVGAAW